MKRKPFFYNCNLALIKHFYPFCWNQLLKYNNIYFLMQAHELNAVGPQFGMAGCDLFSFLTGDADDAEHQKQLLREEKEKAMFSGRKSRRERRAHR